MGNRIIEIVELGKPQSIIQREANPITELIQTHILIEELNEQLLLYGVVKSLPNKYCPKCAYPEIVSSIDSFDSSCPNCGNEWTSKT